ncbi:patatin-like phospholipase family protein [Cumulibacter manganitolerans]|uniref:patatin-like phospholipase family protein n=1 Tax=Cumulibacter manganitolerans TaxID=1884992 RepID=UPI001295FC59|nr:patatin-like phospholipase family protein [Cumulibacter manganitolerans]
MPGPLAPEHWVCLAGGNALGAFHAGALEALLEAEPPVTRVAGASIGAVSAGLLAGGPRDRAAERLRTYWARAEDRSAAGLLPASRQAAASRAMTGGRLGLFHPSLPGIWGALPLVPDDDHLHSTAPMRRTLEELIDFDVLNNGEIRVVVNALDQLTGEDVVFDSARTTITVDHLLASSALPLLFPPVEIDGRLLVDPGLSANLPVRPLFADPPRGDVVCWAIDLWPPVAERASSLDAVARRQQDLVFAAQSRHALELLEATVSAPLRSSGRRAVVHHLGYDGAGWEIAMKGFDYSPASLQRRLVAGRDAMQQALGGSLQPVDPGLHVVRHPFRG